MTTKGANVHLVSPREYELAMFNDLYYRYRSPRYVVVPDLRTIRGQISGGLRQIDVAVHERGIAVPTLAVECKRYGRRLNTKDVESFLGMMEDLGTKNGVLVAPLGFSKSATRRASRSGLALHTLPERDAVRFNWRALARAALPWDEGFHLHMGDALDALLTDGQVAQCMETLEELPYEEWISVIQVALDKDVDKATIFLETIASSHLDDGARYNAIQILHEQGLLDQSFAEDLLNFERDHETHLLLKEILEGSKHGV